MKRIAIVVLVAILALSGLVAAVSLTANKVESVVTGATESAVCTAVSEEGCKIAFDSPMANIGPVPVSLIAAVTYFFILVITIFVGKGQLAAFGPRALFLVSFGAVVYSIVLGTYSWLSSSWCAYCIALYVINGLLLASTVALNGRGFALFEALRFVFGARRTMGVALLVYVVGIASAYFSYWGILKHQTSGYDDIAQKQITRAWADSRFPMPTENAPSVGPKDAKYTFIKFSDFQCPYCHKLWQSLELLRERRPDDVRVVFRNNPLSSECNPFVKGNFHPRACAAAVASVCAQKQDRFWELAEHLFENQKELSDESIRSYAETAGLNLEDFDTCYVSEEAKALVRQDAILAASIGVSATPTSLVNGFRFVGGLPIALWEKILPVLDQRINDAPEPRPMNSQLVRAQKVLRSAPVDVEESDFVISASEEKAPSPVPVVGFVDLSTKDGLALFRTLAQISLQGMGVSISVYVSGGADSEDARRFVCAHLEDRKQLIQVLTTPGFKRHDSLKTAVKQLDTCVSSDRPNALFKAHETKATAMGIKKTPVVFVGGRKMTGKISRVELEMIVAMIAMDRK